MSGHTPGPWVIEELGGNSILRLRIASESNACDVADLNCDRSDEEAAAATRADAALIAAAPELLGALKKAAGYLAVIGTFTDVDRNIAQEMVAAIAKAEGRS